MRNAWKWCFLVLVLYGFIETASLSGLFIIEKKMLGLTYEMVLADKLTEGNRRSLQRLLAGKRPYIRQHPVFGWVSNPKGSFDDEDSDSRRKVAGFGDSFMWGTNIEELEKHDDKFDIVNFGVGGYGLDQGYLRYLEVASTVDLDVVLIGFMTENANRNLSVFRPFYYPIGGMPFAKPRFVSRKGELELIENPLHELSDYRRLLDNPKETLWNLGSNDYYFRYRPESSPLDFSPTIRLAKLVLWGLQHSLLTGAYIKDGVYDTQTKAFQITRQIFDRFYDDVLNNDSLPLIILFPRKEDVYGYRKNGIRVYQPLIDHFVEKKYRFIDILDAFDEHEALETEQLFGSDGMHYNKRGNAIVRNYIYSNLLDSYIGK